MTELLFRSMGTEAHVVVAGGHEALADAARRRLFDLERRWSRFRPDSEVSRLNARAGEQIEVSEETRLLIERAIEAWRITGGTFDPTTLGDLIRAGYDRTFEDIRTAGGPAGASDLVTGCTDIEVGPRGVRLPLGVGFDAGGIGKGLAADIVATEVMASGAAGVCINIGGDLRVLGESPAGSTWTVALEHPSCDRPLTHIGLVEGAVATSTVLRRRWVGDGGAARHHLIDPRTGEPSTTDLTLATVVTGEAWTAEVLAKAVLLRGGRHPFDLIDDREAAALVVDGHGRARVSPAFNAYRGGVAA